MNAATAPDNAATADFSEMKRRQQATWASGDYAVIGTTLQIVGKRWPRRPKFERATECSTLRPEMAMRLSLRHGAMRM